MKKIVNILFIPLWILTLASGLSSQDIKILVPRTLSSLPALELRDQVIQNQKIQVEIFDDHALAMAALVSGNADILMTGFSTGLSRFLSTGDIQHLATPVWGVSSLVAMDPDLKTLREFKGLTIMVPFAGSPLEVQLKVLLEKEGLLGQVKIDYAPIAQQIPLLIQKKAAGICVPEPLVSRLISGNKALQVFTFAQEWAGVNKGDPRSPQVSLFVKNTRAPNKAILSQILILWSLALKELGTNPQETSVKFAPELQVTQDLILKGLSNTILELPDTTTTRALINGYLSITKETPVLPGDEFYTFP